MSAEDVFEGAVGIDLGTTYSSVISLKDLKLV
jgi:molecular chaperone DnaK (HSP70)